MAKSKKQRIQVTKKFSSRIGRDRAREIRNARSTASSTAEFHKWLVENGDHGLEDAIIRNFRLIGDRLRICVAGFEVVQIQDPEPTPEPESTDPEPTPAKKKRAPRKKA